MNFWKSEAIFLYFTGPNPEGIDHPKFFYPHTLRRYGEFHHLRLPHQKYIFHKPYTPPLNCSIVLPNILSRALSSFSTRNFFCPETGRNGTLNRVTRCRKKFNWSNRKRAANDFIKIHEKWQSTTLNSVNSRCSLSIYPELNSYLTAGTVCGKSGISGSCWIWDIIQQRRASFPNTDRYYPPFKKYYRSFSPTMDCLGSSWKQTLPSPDPSPLTLSGQTKSIKQHLGLLKMQESFNALTALSLFAKNRFHTDIYFRPWQMQNIHI